VKLTREFLDGLCGVAREKLKRYAVHGSVGLYAQVTKSGVVSWVYRYRGLLKVERSYVIGRYRARARVGDAGLRAGALPL
jgi:hypothetical protein